MSGIRPQRAGLPTMGWPACSLLVALVLAGCRGDSPSQPPPAPPSPPPPSAREQYIANMNQALDTVLDQVSRMPQNPLLFSANLFFAHEALISSVSTDVLEFYVDGLREAGVHRIDINMGLFPWMDAGQPAADQVIARYDAVIRRIRDARLQLAINPQYSTVFHPVTTFNEWVRSALPVYEQVARRYQPDIFVVVHEPTTMATRMNVAVSPQEWAAFARAAAQVVKKVSPRTRCGAGGLHNEIDYFRAFAALSEIDVLTLDVYALTPLPAYSDMVVIGRQHNKRVYIEETWRTPFVTSTTGESFESLSARGVGDEGFKALDAKWLRALALWAGALNLEAMTPFWTQAFFKYVPEGGGDGLDPGYNAQTAQALLNGERTDTFFAFSGVIRSSVPPLRGSLGRDLVVPPAR